MVRLAYTGIAMFCCYAVITYGEQSPVKNDPDQPTEDCNTNREEALDSYKTVEDFERCARYFMPDVNAWKYYVGGAGEQWTLRENKKAFERYRILMKILQDVSRTDLSVTVLNSRLSMPIAAAPTAYHKLASQRGEIDTAAAVHRARTLMVLSSLSTTLLEDVKKAAPGTDFWMQIYIFKNRTATREIMRRAEIAGFKAFALTVDTPMFGPLPINALQVLQGNSRNLSAVNVAPASTEVDASITIRDLAWMRRCTRLPIIAKGILTPEAAIEVAKAGVSAVWVSNHGGRQLDYSPATIDVLSKIVDALKYRFPTVEVYMDGGVRDGIDVFKALALGAKCVFVGRPVLWGLAVGGQKGVTKVLNILRTELNQTMILAGTPNVHAISRGMVIPQCTCECQHPEI